jgi:large subunit ribosomal protein L18
LNTAQQKQTVVTTVARLTPKEAKRQQRHRKIRSRLTGTADRPRISVYRSNQHVFVQVIDDDAQKTLVSLGTQSQEVKAVVGSEEWKTKTVAAASELGKMLGKKCVDAGITSAVFDRGGFLYHGRVKAVADGCREAGVAI